MRSTWMVALAVPLAMAAAACNTVTPGAHGVLTFTPDDCGEDGCSLNDDLAVGGSIQVSIDDADDEHGSSDFSGLTLITSDPSVFQVQLIDRGVFDSEWRVIGVGAGWAELVVIDEWGYEIDHTELNVRAANHLAVQHVSGNAVGPTTRLGYDQVWTVNAMENVELQAVPYRNDARLTGRMAYHVDIDEVLFSGLEPGSDLEEGELDFRVPMGEYDVSFQSPDGSTIRLLIVSQ